jgi:CheY-like chemotaxis protein
VARILVVDDDPDFVEVTSTVLESYGHQVSSAANGEQALAAMRREKPDLVVLDVVMAYELDGLDVTETMRQDAELRTIPVLMISSLPVSHYAELRPSNTCLNVDAWLSKPVPADELLRQVAGLLR